MQMHF